MRFTRVRSYQDPLLNGVQIAFARARVVALEGAPTALPPVTDLNFLSVLDADARFGNRSGIERQEAEGAL